MKRLLSTLSLLAMLGASLPALATEPTLHQVYQAAEAGRMAEAQQMMKEVLQQHPNSAKAHFVEAELLASEGRLAQAAGELATAEKLAPGLPFAKPESVSALRQRLEHRSTSTSPAAAQLSAASAGNDSGLPWGMIFGGLGLVAFILWASRLMSQRNAPAGSPQPAYGGGYASPAAPAAPAYNGNGAPGYGYPGMAPAPTQSSGLGSQMLGGLATGAAVGAGVVAGEALMHHFLDGNSGTAHAAQPTVTPFQNFDPSPNMPNLLDDMGGNDFGIADSASWDDGGSAASDDSDWN